MADNFPLENGQLTIIRVANPAVASNWLYAPSLRRIERPIAIQFQIVTDGTAADRECRLRIHDATGAIISIGSSQATPANNTELWQYTQNIGLFTNNSVAYQFLPPNLELPLDGDIRSNVQNIQAGDQLSAIIIVLATWVRT